MSSSKHHTRLKRPHERRKLRNNQAAQAARERKHSRPWQRAVVAVRQHVARGELPAGCLRVVEALAACHQDHGAPVRDQELWLGYGWHRDPQRTEARARSRADPPVFEGISNEAHTSRRWAIACVRMLVEVGILRRWFGGPNRDYRRNARAALQRAHPKTGERHEHVQGIGGSGWANGYTVEGIPDPVPPEEDPPPRPGPPPEPERPPSKPAAWVTLRQRHETERLERQRRRLAERDQPRGP